MPDLSVISKIAEVEATLNETQDTIDEARRLPMQTYEFASDLDVAQLRLNVRQAHLTRIKNSLITPEAKSD